MTNPVVLVVEDNRATRKMLRVALQAEGYGVLEAESGSSAFDTAVTETPALVVLDCRLPDSDGFDVSRRIRRALPSIPLIALTGWPHADETRMLSAGFSDILIEPIEPSRLIEIIERHVGRAPPRTGELGRVVLVVDDNGTQRRLAKLGLTAAGFRVIVAESSAEALRMMRRHRPDVVVSNVLMEEIDGFRLTRMIRSEPDLAATPIVLASAHHHDDEDRILAERFGASRYVSRTGSFDQLIRAVIDVLDSPTPQLFGSPPAEQLRSDYLRSIARQLENQAALSADLDLSSAFHTNAFSILDRMSHALAQQLDPESALDETLSGCLDAAELAVGAILLRTPDGGFSLRTQVGSVGAVAWIDHVGLLERALLLGSISVPSVEAGAGGEALLAKLGACSALVVPIVARDEALGALVLASSEPSFVGADRASLVRVATSVSRQLGQALSLSRAFRRLTEAEQRNAALLENAHDAIGVLDAAGVFVEANRRWQEILQADRCDIVGRALIDFTPEDRRELSASALQEVLAQGGGSIPLGCFERADASFAWLELSIAVVDVGRERLVLAVGRDLTERMRLEDQLRQSQKMEAIGRLAGGVAHDFNNLLSVILSYSALLSEDLPPGDPRRGDVAEISKAGERATDLTRQLLLFSRQQVVEPKNICLSSLVSSMDKMLRRLVGEDIEIVTLPGSSDSVVRVDPGSMEQLLMNLVVNARDAMPMGGEIQLRVADVLLDARFAKQHLGAKEGLHVLLSVSDTGIGMDQETCARAFEPFFTTKEKGKGTGLGLSTVFGIVQQSGGYIWFESEPGQGTTFRIYLPRVDAPHEVNLGARSERLPRGNETILVVEDDDQVRTVTVGILRRHGYEVLEARNAGEALLLSEQHPRRIHLLLSDVIMPRMSGPELAKRLTPLRPDMRVLHMSGYTDDSAVRHGVLASEIAFLQKPITIESITRKVRAVLDAKD